MSVQVVSRFTDVELLASYPLGFVVAKDENIKFINYQGLSSKLDGLSESAEIMCSGQQVIVVEGHLAHAINPDLLSHPTISVSLLPNEKLLPLVQGDILVAFRQKNPDKYGEPWYIRTISDTGAVMWERFSSYVPFIGACDDEKLVIAEVDICAGGDAWLKCFSKHTGQKLWQTHLGSGTWRSLAVCGNNDIIVVLDSGAARLSSDGEIRWRYIPHGAIISAAAGNDILALSTSNRENKSISKILGGGQIITLNSAGNMVWSRKCQHLNTKLYLRENILTIMQPKKISCLNLSTGSTLFTYKVTGNPITCMENVILIVEGTDLSIVKLGN